MVTKVLNYNNVFYKAVSSLTVNTTSYSCDRSRTGNDRKLANNLSRAKSKVFELALSNKWDYFVTFTFDASKCDRESYEDTVLRLCRSISAYNRNYSSNIRYLLVPEYHSDGKSFHMHGFISGISKFLSKNDHGYLTWEYYNKHFGFCCFDCIVQKDNTARQKMAKYIVKYITKNETCAPLLRHSYYRSLGLNKASVTIIPDVVVAPSVATYQNSTTIIYDSVDVIPLDIFLPVNRLKTVHACKRSRVSKRFIFPSDMGYLRPNMSIKRPMIEIDPTEEIYNIETDAILSGFVDVTDSYEFSGDFDDLEREDV